VPPAKHSPQKWAKSGSPTDRRRNRSTGPDRSTGINPSIRDQALVFFCISLQLLGPPQATVPALLPCFSPPIPCHHIVRAAASAAAMSSLRAPGDRTSFSIACCFSTI
jgi:hypothetical protein